MAKPMVTSRVRQEVPAPVKGLALIGPAFVAAVAYVDPGNFATNISGGAEFGFLLLWVIVAANLMAMLIQNLSAKMGLATGRNLAELCREHFPPPVTRGLWVQAELVAMATDLAEFVGAAIALNLLFGVPPFAAGLMTAAVAFAIKLTSPGPVFYRQTRVGIDGKQFRMIKFRSMVADADARRADLLQLERTEGNEVLFKMRNDPRVTRVGAFLRRFSLDELPQLFNVLRGEMSLVGPRPPLPEEVAGYNDDATRRLKVKPGVTGLWQVSGRSDLTWEESLRLDLRYADNWSMMLDLSILWRTVRAVTSGSGAY